MARGRASFVEVARCLAYSSPRAPAGDDDRSTTLRNRQADDRDRRGEPAAHEVAGDASTCTGVERTDDYEAGVGERAAQEDVVIVVAQRDDRERVEVDARAGAASGRDRFRGFPPVHRRGEGLDR